MRFRPSVLLCACLLVAGSAILSAQESKTAQAPNPAERLYRLEAGDSIDLRFFYNAELNESVQIRPDGNISMHLIGEVAAAGRTIADLTSFLDSKYKDIIKQPSLTIQIRSYANRKVFVGGEVARPGVIPLVGRQTVLAAIMEAGGLRPTARRGEVLLVRQTEAGTPQTFRVSLNGAGNAAPQAASFSLQPFDVVLVSRSNIVKANQAIDQYVRQMIPALLTGGFTYLFNGRILP
jgi:polysaccharide export outer membrane protein